MRSCSPQSEAGYKPPFAWTFVPKLARLLINSGAHTDLGHMGRFPQRTRRRFRSLTAFALVILTLLYVSAASGKKPDGAHGPKGSDGA